jgi:N6-L-threonylcarbamoyladenine synthase
MELVGQTRDDAAGEAFDKGARMLGLPYPGGPSVDRLATSGNPHAFRFPAAKMDAFDFSFSGIKTALMYLIKDRDPAFIRENLSDLCASYQHSIVKMLLDKLKSAAGHFKVREVGLAGGVAANSGLRNQFTALGEASGWNTYIPEFNHCTDNAAMIAIAAHHRFLAGRFSDLEQVPVASLSDGFSLH